MFQTSIVPLPTGSAGVVEIALLPGTGNDEQDFIGFVVVSRTFFPALPRRNIPVMLRR